MKGDEISTVADSVIEELVETEPDPVARRHTIKRNSPIIVGDVRPRAHNFPKFGASPAETQRASDCWRAHAVSFAHAPQAKMKEMCRFGTIAGNIFSERDVDLAWDLFGPCEVCIRMHTKQEPSRASTREPWRCVGENVAIDSVKMRGVTIGGNNWRFYGVDLYSGYMVVVFAKSKDVKSIISVFGHIISHFNSFGHRILSITTDAEANFGAAESWLNTANIQYGSTVPGRHNKPVERYIQKAEIMEGKLLGQLPVILPVHLDAELCYEAVQQINRIPCKASGYMSPVEVVTGRKPDVQDLVFGQAVVVADRHGSRHQRSITAILMSTSLDRTNKYRVYCPDTNSMCIKGKAIPVRDYPEAWHFPLKTGSSLAKYQVANDLRQAALGNVLVATSRPVGVNIYPQSGVQVVPIQDSRVSGFFPVEATDSDDDENSPDFTPVSETTDWLSAIADRNATASTIDLAPAAVLASAAAGAAVDTTTAATPTSPTGVYFAPTVTPEPVAAPEPVAVSESANVEMSPLAPSPAAIHSEAPAEQTNRRGVERRQAATRVTDYADFNRFGHGHRHLNAESVLESMLLSDPLFISVRRCSIKKALAGARATDSVKAIEAELTQLFDTNKALLPMAMNTLSSQDIKQAVLLFPFLTEKYRQSMYEKMKCRVVAGGHLQQEGTFGETSSPTVNPIAVFILLHLAANLDRELFTADVPGAFLIPPMDPSEAPLYGYIDPTLASIAVKLFPHFKKYVTKNGMLYFRFNKYVYGLKQASAKFYEFLHKYLTEELGFVVSSADRCVFIHVCKKNGVTIILLHVDDLLMSSTVEGKEWILEHLIRAFNVTTQLGLIFDYLALTVERDRENRTIRVTMPGYTRKIIEGFPADMLPADSPASLDLFDDDSDEKMCKPFDFTVFASLLMTLMFMARFVRADTLLPVSFLATKMQSPTHGDYKKLTRVVRYLKKYPDIGVTLGGRENGYEFEAHADASHHVHPDAKGQGGILLTMGKRAVYAKTFKLKLTTMSSTESELVVQTEAMTYIIWVRALLRDLGFECLSPTTLFQDNQSAIQMTNAGRGSFKRTKHLVGRFTFCKELIDEGVVVLEWCQTGDMQADFLTKPKPGAQLVHDCARAGIN